MGHAAHVLSSGSMMVGPVWPGGLGSMGPATSQTFMMGQRGQTFSDQGSRKRPHDEDSLDKLVNSDDDEEEDDDDDGSF